MAVAVSAGCGSERFRDSIAVFAHGRFEKVEVVDAVVVLPAVYRFDSRGDAGQRNTQVCFDPRDRLLVAQHEILKTYFDPVLWPGSGLDEIVLVFPGNDPAQSLVFGFRVGNAEPLEVIGDVATEDTVAWIADPE